MTLTSHTLPTMLKDEEILLGYLEKLNQVKPCPRNQLLSLAGNERNLERWLWWLSKDGLVKVAPPRKGRVFYSKTDDGEVMHWILRRHPVVLMLKHYGRKRMPPVFRPSYQRSPPPTKNQERSANGVALTQGSRRAVAHWGTRMMKAIGRSDA